MAALGLLLFVASYGAAVALRLPINRPRWALLFLGSLLTGSWAFSVVFDALRDLGQDSLSLHYAWIHPGWLHELLVLGGCAAGCLLGGLRAMRRATRQAAGSRPAA